MRFVLLVVVTVICGVTVDGNNSCPLWHYHHQGKCKCGDSLHGAIFCSDEKVFLRVDYAMDVWQNTTVAALSRYAYCNFSSIPSNLRVYSTIPNDTPPEELNGIMCNESNRMGFMCGKCLPNYGPSVHSFKCYKCHLSLPSAIALYLTIKLLPTTIFFIIIMMFRINIFRGPMLGYILFCQALIVMQRLSSSFVSLWFYQLNQYTRLLGYTPFIISTILGLDFTGISPHFCINDKLEDSDVLFINYVLSVLFPLCLVTITIILIELHVRHFKVVVFCWKPFHGCFDKFGRNWSALDSFILAFASLIFLSFTSLTYDARDFLVLMKIHTADHVLINNVPLVYPSIHPYTPKFIIYTILVCVLLLFVGVVLSLLLLLHPIPMFRERLQKCCSQRFILGLNTFMETFQSPFKDGCNGTRDYRIVPGVGATLFLLSIIIDLLAHVAHYENYFWPIFVVGFVILSMLCAYARPCKSSSGNLSIVSHFLWLAVINALVVLWEQDFVMDTIILASVFAIVLPIPHILMFLWLCYRLEKKFHLRKRSVVCFNRVMGQIKFGKRRMVGVQTPLLNDHCLNSPVYREQSSSS